MKRVVSTILLVILLTSMLYSAFKILPVGAVETIYIRADGSIDPPTAPISTVDNVTYTVTGNITSSGNGIIVERGNIIVDGDGYTLQGSDSGYGFYWIGIHNVTIKNTNVKEFGSGFHLEGSNHNIIWGNNVTDNGVGIDMHVVVFFNTIRSNNISKNGCGVYVLDSGRNYFFDNIMTDNHHGVVITNSPENCFWNNSIANCRSAMFVAGVGGGGGIQYVDTSNTVNGKPIYYLVDRHDLVLDKWACPNVGYLALVNCDNITVNELELEGNGQGLLLSNTNGSRVVGNNITQNGIGIDSYYCHDNVFSDNRLADNENVGILLFGSSNSTICRNSLTNSSSGIYLGQREYGHGPNCVYENNITNSLHGFQIYIPCGDRIWHNNVYQSDHVHLDAFPGQVNYWDNGYPSGGNYWSDYAGADLYSGQYQNETGSDGIGDTYYLINDYNRDNYPLTAPYPCIHAVAVKTVTPSKTVVGLNYTAYMNVAVINMGHFTETFNVTVYANTTIIETKTNIPLPIGNSTTITFTWNTSGFAKGNYTISACASPVPDETDTSDNLFIDGWVFVAMPGDVNADGIVDIFDCVIVALAFGSTHSDPISPWNPNADINNDGTVDIFDMVVVALYFGETG